jgi:enterochelin esterase-like enzyme
MEYPAIALAGVIPVRIYQPPCYRVNQAYPTIYLLHGYPFDEGQWEELGALATVDGGQSELDWPPVLMVMPRVPEPLFTKTDGGPGSYETELVEGLVPYIDANFSTDPQAAHRALVGLSRGGVWALEAGLRHPEIFDTVVALSPSLSVNSARPPYDPVKIVQEEGPFPSQILVTGGTAEPGFLKGIRDFVSVMRTNRVDHIFLLTSGAHNAEAWMEILDQVFIFAIQGVNGEVEVPEVGEYPEP